MKEIVFVTTNEGKIKSAQKHFKNLELLPFRHELKEMRSDSVREIAEDKARQAYNIVKKPCIAQDSGFYIKALNGFPKVYVNLALDTIGIEGIMRLMEGIEDRRCEFRTCTSYYDGNTMKSFESFSKGHISKAIEEIDREEQWSSLWHIYIPENFNKCLALFSQDDFEELEKIKEKSCMVKFKEWYTSKLSSNIVI